MKFKYCFIYLLFVYVLKINVARNQSTATLKIGGNYNLFNLIFRILFFVFNYRPKAPTRVISNCITYTDKHN